MKIDTTFFAAFVLACILNLAIPSGMATAQTAVVPPADPAPEGAQKIQDVNAQVRVARSAKPAVDPRKAELFKASVIASQMTVTVTKDGSVPVKATFNLMNGSLDFSGADPAVRFAVDVTSWNSNLIERDERVRKIFFRSDEQGFGMMALTVAKLDAAVVSRLRSEGKMQRVTVTGNLSFNGKVQPVTAELNLSFNDKNRLAAVTAEPAVIKISEWGLSENLTALMQICGHKSVADEVKVDFAFEFEAVK